MTTRASRLAPFFLVAATALFVTGVVTKSSLFMLLSLAATASLLVSLGLEDRRMTKQAGATTEPVATAAAAPATRPVDEALVAADVAAGVAAASKARGEVDTTIDLDNNTITQSVGDLAVKVDLDKALDVEDLLATITGVGPAKVTALAASFPTPVQLRAATKDELTAVKGVGPALADRIIAAVR